MLITSHEELKAYRTENRLWQGIPSIEVTRKGRIFISFYSGETLEGIGNYAALIKSDDNGESFSEPIAAAFLEEHRCFDPCVWIDPLGRLWFTWACSPNGGVYAAVCDDPDAELLKWHAPVRIGGDVMMNKPTVTKNGEWLFPIAVWKYGFMPSGVKNSDDQDDRAFAYLSIDDGKSLRKLGGISAPERSFDEHMILELNDDRLAMFIRTFYGIAVSYSYDGGVTWTPAKDSGLGGPCSRFHIRRLSSGRILLINHVNFKGRNNLTALLSEDDGATWKHSLLLDERDYVSYPDAKEADDGYIYITYDRDRGCCEKSLEGAYSHAREILLAKIKEEDIIAGHIVCKDSRLKVVASKLGGYCGENTNPYGEIKKYSEAEFAEIARSMNTDDIISAIFENYGINCMNMYKLDRQRMDKLIEKLESGCADRDNTVCELLRLIRSVSSESGDVTADELPVVSRIKKFIEENENDAQSAALDEIADSMNMSKYYLCHIFKKSTNMTLTAWRNHLKIEKAKKLLADSDKKITEIAHECGFGGASYFSEVFLQAVKISPEMYRSLIRSNRKDEKSAILKSMLQKTDFLCTDISSLEKCGKLKTYFVSKPTEEYLFLHEAAIIEHKGRLFAAWYNNRKTELFGHTPIRFAVSDDGGATWSEPEVVVEDTSGKLLYCPPVFGEDGGKLYMLLNSMVSADHIHSLDLYVYDENSCGFTFVRSTALPFKLNTNVYRTDGGKLIIGGRIAESLDGFPQIPAVLISDSGRIDSEWRVVKIAPDKYLPDGSEYIHPEVTLIAQGNTVYAFCRNDVTNVPTVYISEDGGENWSGAYASDIPFANSKIYSGTLSDGRNYVIGNLDPKRFTLYILFSRKGEMKFDKGYILQSGFCGDLGCGCEWMYPCAYEANGKLYIICTVSPDHPGVRGAAVMTAELEDI